jgi:hypothetical protein
MMFFHQDEILPRMVDTAAEKLPPVANGSNPGDLNPLRTHTLGPLVQSQRSDENPSFCLLAL